ncbi:MAG: CpaE family protein [Candidatus Binatia bacterium]
MSREKIRTIIIGQGSEDRTSFVEVLTSLPGFELSVEHAGIGDGIECVERCRSEAAFVFAGRRASEGLALVSKLRQQHPGLGIFVVSDARDADLIVNAIRAGADDVFSPECSTADLLRPLVKLAEMRRRTPSHSGPHRILTAFSPHGGSGVTTFSINLAITLRRMTGLKVVLVDLDFQNGETPVFLNFRHPYSVLDVIESVETLDPVFLQGTLYEHPSGMRVLPPPPMLEDSESISGNDVARILKALQTQFDYVVVDTPPYLSEVVLPALENAQSIYLLTDNTVPAVRAMQRLLGTFKRLGIAQDNIRLILSRAVDQAGITAAELAEVLKLSVSGQLPNDHTTATEAVTQGKPLSEVDPESDLVAAIECVAGRLCARKAESSPVKRSGLLARMFS